MLERLYKNSRDPLINHEHAPMSASVNQGLFSESSCRRIYAIQGVPLSFEKR